MIFSMGFGINITTITLSLFE